MQSSGDEVVSYLQKVCSNDVEVPVGGVVHTGMQNEHGGYENDCLLIRRATNRYHGSSAWTSIIACIFYTNAVENAYYIH